MNRLGKVAVLMGGRSGEREVSLKSGRAVLDALLRQGVDAVGIDAGKDVLGQLQTSGVERVFIALHGRGGEDGVIQGALETLGLPYTGSGVLGSALGMDKVRAKQLWLGVGLPTPAFRVLTADTNLSEVIRTLGVPLAVKPVREGSSLGVARVEDELGLARAYAAAAILDPSVIAEHWVIGKEYTVALLGRRPLPVIGLQTPRGFYDYHAKYLASDTTYLCPSGLDPQQERALQELALQAFDALDCSGWGRVDFMCDEVGQPWLLEVNTVPGMTDHSLVPMAARAAGMDFDQLVMAILEASLK